MIDRRFLTPTLKPLNDDIDKLSWRLKKFELKEDNPLESNLNPFITGVEEEKTLLAIPPTQTMKELCRPKVDVSISCIISTEEVRNQEVNGQYFNMLPIYQGLSVEDPLTLLRDYMIIVSHFSGKLDVTDEQIR